MRFLPFAAMAGISAAFYAPYVHTAQLRDLLASGRASIVEGPIENFHSGAGRGRSWENYSVRSVAFGYWDTMGVPGFHRTRARGGPLRAGLPVRISYGPGKEILRLEIPKNEPYAPPAELGFGARILLIPLGLLSGLALWRGKTGRFGPPCAEQELLFIETMVSARRPGTGLSHLAGYNNALALSLTRETLHIRLGMPFRLFMPDVFGLEHDIALGALSKCEKQELPGWMRIPAYLGGDDRGALELAYRAEAGASRGIVLYLGARDELWTKLRELRPDLA